LPTVRPWTSISTTEQDVLFPVLSDRLFTGSRPAGFLLLAALLLRLFVLPWDAGTPPSPHPDERRVVSVAQGLDGWRDDPGFFAYGSLHFQAVRLFAALQGGSDDWVRLMAGGRMLSLLASMGCLLLGWGLAFSAWGERAAWIFLLIGAWAPLDLQLSHYGTVEAHHSLWIMLCLAALYQLLRTGKWGWAAASGAAFGGALAVKIASVGLLAPLGVLLLLFLARGRESAPSFFHAMLFAISAFLVFDLGEPWAFAGGVLPPGLLVCLAAAAGSALLGSVRPSFRRPAFILGSFLALSALAALLQASGLVPGQWAAHLLRLEFNPRFLRDTGSQIAMVSGRLEFPYVRIYRHSTPLLYTLKNLGFWGLGPGLLAAFLWASWRGLRKLLQRHGRLFSRRIPDHLGLLLILLAWVLPNLLRLSTLRVKFLRYEAPLLVPMALVAAWGLSRLRGNVRRRTAVAVAASSIFWGLAYAWALITPHPFAVAAPWLQNLIPGNAVVAWEHWDEHLPSIGERALSLDSYDLPDNRAKIEKLAGVLHDADWVILTSNRVRRTVLANPELYRLSGNFYRELLEGRAGYEIISRAERAPRFFGLEAPVQSADESFLNYEFPRVLVLRKTGVVDVAGLVERCEHPPAPPDALSSASVDRLVLRDTPHIPFAALFRQQASWTLIRLMMLLLAAFSGWILLAPFLENWPDRGFGLCLVTFWVLPPWMLWMGSELLHLPVCGGTATAVFLLPMLAAAMLLLSSPAKRADARRRLDSAFPAILKVLAVLIGVFALFLLIRASNPAIFWGEKPMDFSFFNAFLNARHWPPPEVWMAGRPLHYYYFGEILVVFPALLSGADPAVAYNLSCAMIPALSAALLASIGLYFSRRKQGMRFLWLPLLVVLAGNLAWLRHIDFLQAGRFFDLWWATSRVIPGIAIDEYPLWTAIFADLHAHFIAMPLFIALPAWALVLSGARKLLPALLGCALVAGALAAVNPWDIPMAAACCGMGVLLLGRHPFRDLFRLGLAALLGMLLVAPFLVELLAWIHQGTGGFPILAFNTGDFAPAWALLLHFGLFLIPLAILAFRRPGRDVPMTLALVFGGVGLGWLLGSSAAALALGGAMLFLTALEWTPDPRRRLAWVLAGTALLGIAFAERFTLIDRMNTIFKIYNGVWPALALGLGIFLLRLRPRSRLLLTWIVLPLLVLTLLNLPLGIVQGWLQPRVASPRPTLDGRAYLAHFRPGDDYLIRCLRGLARPEDIVAEAAGPSYRDFTRIAMNTGLASVVGWEWHLRQRGQDPLEIAARYEALKELYSGNAPLYRREILDRYHVDWIVCGELERRHYGLHGDNPFAGVPDVELWARRGRSLLYRVRH